MTAEVTTSKALDEIKIGGIGASRKRVEDDRFIRGQGNYLDDIRLPGMLFGQVLRSPYAHAKVISIDTTRALALHFKRPAMRFEHLSDGLAVPHLLEHPTGEERGDGGVLVGRRQQEVAQVAHGVVLDVVHVADAAKGPLVERVALEAREVDVRDVDDVVMSCRTEPSREHRGPRGTAGQNRIFHQPARERLGHRHRPRSARSRR